MLKTKDKEKILKAVRGEKKKTQHRGKRIRITADIPINYTNKKTKQ